MTLPKSIKDRIVSKITEKFKVKDIILFGSQATGKADRHSDVDILVISSNPIKGKRRDLMLKIDETLDEINYAFDILILTSDEFERDRFIPGTVARYASQQGKVLYGNK